MLFSFYNRTLRNFGLSLGLSLLFCFSPSAGFAQNVDDELEDSLISVSDLTPQQFSALSSVAPVLLGATGSSGNITNDVAAILSWLLTLRNFSVSGGERYLKVLPIWNSSSGGSEVSFAKGFLTILGETDSLIRTDSFLYEIQRALYGHRGVPSSSQALLPFLYSAYGFTNALYGSDGSANSGVSVADLISPLSSFYSGFESPSETSAYLESLIGLYHDHEEDLESFFSFYSAAPAVIASDPDTPYDGSALYVMEGALADVWRDDASSATDSESALQVVDPIVASEISRLQQPLADLLTAVSSQNGGSSASYSISNTLDSSSGELVDETDFNNSSIGSKFSSLASSLASNTIPASIGAVNTNQIFSLTNAAMAAMPSTAPVVSFVQDSFSPFDYSNTGTGTEITLFNSFNHSGIVIPGMSLDLGDSRLSLLRSRCNLLARFSYGLLFLFLTIIRIRSFLDYVIGGFSSLYGEDIEGDGTAAGFN